MRRTKSVTPRLWLAGFALLPTLASSSQVTSSTAEIKSPDLNLILQRLEDIQHQEPAQSRPYEVIREYKVLRGYNTQPTSEVMAQINFVPPDTKTYKIIPVAPQLVAASFPMKRIEADAEYQLPPPFDTEEFLKQVERASAE